jgi:ubiquinone/menaquinone biosynthesis C-methylase UbiE
LELAIGTGRNIAYYRDDVRLTGVDISAEMLEFARAQARDLGRDVDLRVADAQNLEFASDESFDAVVSTLSLCTIPDDRKAAAEAIRVLRPDGRFILLEHVRSPSRLVRAGQRAIEPLAVRFQHDHLTRDPADYLESVGFQVDVMVRSKAGIVERLVARKPRSAG